MPDIVLPQDLDLNIDPATIFTPEQLALLTQGADTTPPTDATGPDAVSGASGPDAGVTPPDPAAAAPPPADPAPADVAPPADQPADAPVDMVVIPFDDGPYQLPHSEGWVL